MLTVVCLHVPSISSLIKAWQSALLRSSLRAHAGMFAKCCVQLLWALSVCVSCFALIPLHQQWCCVCMFVLLPAAACNSTQHNCTQTSMRQMQVGG
jgi:hypothetical protein